MRRDARGQALLNVVVGMLMTSLLTVAVAWGSWAAWRTFESVTQAVQQTSTLVALPWWEQTAAAASQWTWQSGTLSTQWTAANGTTVAVSITQSGTVLAATTTVTASGGTPVSTTQDVARGITAWSPQILTHGLEVTITFAHWATPQTFLLTNGG